MDLVRPYLSVIMTKLFRLNLMVIANQGSGQLLKLFKACIGAIVLIFFSSKMSTHEPSSSDLSFRVWKLLFKFVSYQSFSPSFSLSSFRFSLFAQFLSPANLKGKKASQVAGFYNWQSCKIVVAVLSCNKVDKITNFKISKKSQQLRTYG